MTTDDKSFQGRAQVRKESTPITERKAISNSRQIFGETLMRHVRINARPDASSFVQTYDITMLDVLD